MCRCVIIMVIVNTNREERKNLKEQPIVIHCPKCGAKLIACGMTLECAVQCRRCKWPWEIDINPQRIILIFPDAQDVEKSKPGRIIG